MELTSKGYLYSDKFNKSVTILLAGDGAGSKLAKARKAGVRVIEGEQAVIDFLNGI